MSWAREKTCGGYLSHPQRKIQTIPYCYAVSTLHYAKSSARIMNVDEISSHHRDDRRNCARDRRHLSQARIIHEAELSRLRPKAPAILWRPDRTKIMRQGARRACESSS